VLLLIVYTAAAAVAIVAAGNGFRSNLGKTMSLLSLIMKTVAALMLLVMVMEAVWAKQTDAVATTAVATITVATGIVAIGVVATAVAVTAAASYGFLSHLN